MADRLAQFLAEDFELWARYGICSRASANDLIAWQAAVAAELAKRAASPEGR